MPKVLGIYTDWSRPGGKEGYGAIGWYRVKNALEKLGHETVGKISLGTPEMALDLKKRGDIWFWKPVDNEGMNVFIDTAKVFTGAKMVLDIDDEPFNLNKDHPLYDEIVKKSERVKRMIEISDHLVVSTQQLKDSLAHFGKRTTVIPNAIDPDIWKVKWKRVDVYRTEYLKDRKSKTTLSKGEKERKDGKIRIGWIGSASHIADIPVVMGAFEEIVKKYPNVEIHLCGFLTELKFQNPSYIHHTGTSGYDEFPQFLADLDLDIAVAPLLDTKFNRSKSNIKWLEHSMLEIPMVLSNIPPYKGSVTPNVTGFLATGKGQWVKYLSQLIEDEELRNKIGKEAKKAVLKDWTIDKQLPKYEALFEMLEEKDITVYTSVTGDKDTLMEDQNTKGANFVAFTDKQSDCWDVRKPYDHFKDNRRNSRIAKIMPHLFFNSTYSVYLDGNITLKVPAQQLIDEFLKDKDIAVFRHVGRDCVYEEAQACMALGKGDKYELAEQVRSYAQLGHKEHAGLCECGVIIRRHTPRIAELNEKWWAQYCRYSDRDQMSFPIAFPLDEVNQIESSAWRHPYFQFYAHKYE